MDIYEHLNVEECHLKAKEAGRAAHMVRNYLQGYTNLDHPEFACLDKLSAKIEGNLRKIRAKINKKAEVKGKILKVLKSTRFLQKFIAPSQLEDKALDPNSLAEVRALVDTMNKLVANLDQEINLAGFKKYSQAFSAKMPAIEIERCEGGLMEKFCPTKFVEEIKTLSKITFPERKSHSLKIAYLMSNKAHQLQDAVAEYILSPNEREQANRIINIAGNIENEARNVIKTFNKKPNVKLQKIQRLLNKISVNNDTIECMVKNSGFLIQNKKDLLLSHLQMQRENVEVAKKIIQIAA